MNDATLHIVVTCTNRKRKPVGRSLHLRNVPGEDVEARHREWLNRLRSEPSQAVPAPELYCGDHWFVVRDLAEKANRLHCAATMWIASAGYGLVPWESGLVPYAATFSPGHPDSVSRSSDPIRRKQDQEDWWGLMSRWEGPTSGKVRSLTELTHKNPQARVLVVASPAYIRAMHSDLLQATTNLLNPDALSILSGGLDAPEPLKSAIIPCEARARDLLGGALTSLNVRFAARAVEELGVSVGSRQSLATWAKGFLNGCRPLPMPRRQKTTDDEVRDYVRKALSKGEAASCTRLHRAYRSSGWACEQSRFRNIYRQVTGEKP